LRFTPRRHLTVLRFWDIEALQQLDAVVEVIQRVLVRQQLIPRSLLAM
jgi:very-short-patch-repair endonuclease